MALQMIATFRTAGFAAWKDAFDAEREALAQAGLSVLQIWREPDAPDTAWVLFRVNDRGRAEAFLSGAAKAGPAGATTHHFVETA